jgi:hypothetical protein
MTETVNGIDCEGKMCGNCKSIMRHTDRDGTLYPLFYCGLFKLDLLTDFIGQFKRQEVCLSANRNQ